MRSAALPVALAMTFLAGCSPVSILTQHNDQHRSGTNNREQHLNVSNVDAGNFGLLYTRHVVGQIVAQPLYADGRVYVATEANMIYAFDANDTSPTAAPLWALGPLGPPVRRLDLDSFVGETCFIRTNKQQGITATPVINDTMTTLYAEAKIERDRSTYEHRLFAIDMIHGQVRNPGGTLIDPTIRNGRTGETIRFRPAVQLSRPGLLLSQGVVYAAFGAINCDTPHRGWVVGYDERTLQQLAAITTMPNPMPPTAKCATAPNVALTGPPNIDRNGAGIWQAGNGLVADHENNIYFMTGNGYVDKLQHPFNLGDSFVKLALTAPGQPTADGIGFTVDAVYTPANQEELRIHDIDLGSAGPLFLEGFGLLIGGGKQGIFYVLDTNLEPFQPEFQATQVFGHPLPRIPSDCGEVNELPHIHGSPVFWQSGEGTYIYVMGEKDRVRAYKLDPKTRRIGAAAAFTSPATVAAPGAALGPDPGCLKCMPGGILSVSANLYDPATGIVWVSVPKGGDAESSNQFGILHALNAITLLPLWNNAADTPPYFFAKFTPPTIAEGKVFLAGIDGTDHPNVGENTEPTKGILMVYGQRPAPRSRPAALCPRDPQQDCFTCYQGIMDGLVDSEAGLTGQERAGVRRLIGRIGQEANEVCR